MLLLTLFLCCSGGTVVMDKQKGLLKTTPTTEIQNANSDLNNSTVVSPSLENLCDEKSGSLKLSPIYVEEYDISDKKSLIIKTGLDEKSQQEDEEEIILSTNLQRSYMNSLNMLNKIPLDEKDQKLSKTCKVTTWSNLIHFFSATSFHGLPYIVSSPRRSCLRIILWISALFLSLVLMAISIGFVTRQYISQSTALSSKQHFHETLPFPAVTLCNKNLNRKSVVVDTGIDLTQLTIFLNLLFGNPYLAGDSFDLEDFINHSFGLEEFFFYNNSGHQLKDMLYFC